MDNKFLWAIGAFVIGYYIASRKTKKIVKEKVDKAVDTIQKEDHENINKAIDMAMQLKYDLPGLKQVINAQFQ